LIGNAMAGLMLRSIRNFRPGDFIVVDGHRADRALRIRARAG
jgi:hypothetical protein